MEQWQIEYLHQQGKMPDQIYYQQIDKPVWLKIEEQKQKLIDEIQQKKQEEELQLSIEKQISEIIDNLFDSLNLN